MDHGKPCLGFYNPDSSPLAPFDVVFPHDGLPGPGREKVLMPPCCQERGFVAETEAVI